MKRLNSGGQSHASKIVSNIKPESQEYRIVISYTNESNKPNISDCSSVWKRETEEDGSASLRSMD